MSNQVKVGDLDNLEKLELKVHREKMAILEKREVLEPQEQVVCRECLVSGVLLV